jgi:hypothetical protein
MTREFRFLGDDTDPCVGEAFHVGTNCTRKVPVMSRLQALASRLARIAVFVLLAVPASAPAWSALAPDDHCVVARMPAQAQVDTFVDLTDRPWSPPGRHPSTPGRWRRRGGRDRHVHQGGRMGR